MENTHDGNAIKPEYFKKLREMLDSHNTESNPLYPSEGLTRRSNHGIKVHIDGARIVNALIKHNLKLTDYTKYVDSITICFSKGLGAPVGAVLCGTKEFILE